MKKLTFNVSLLLLSFSYTTMTFGQNCFDADFESGSLGGYEAYHGEISHEGVVIFRKGVNNRQHKIMKISDGYDPIANQNCIKNKSLLAVGNGAGRYTLRLGDSPNGSMTSKIVLSFDVTDDVAFFLLRYAVVLEDPMHGYEVQPRFELRITDEDGNPLDCGSYQVRAAANNPGFESCGNWRVRPWTTAGFELKSLIGKKINIEIVSTDCGYGGHGGYAYIDATCKPLSLDLTSYCPGSGYAKYTVVDGFEQYRWSTGSTASSIEIQNPVPGTEYIVTVTSATGCTLVLRDTLPTLPSLDDLVPSFFDGDDTLKVCFGEEITYSPKGMNIEEVYSPQLGYSSEVFYLFADSTRDVEFITSDNLGCAFDTMQLHIEVTRMDINIEVIPTCADTNSGEIIIDTLSNIGLLTSIDGSPFAYKYMYDGLVPGTYMLTTQASANQCEITRSVVVPESKKPELQLFEVKPATCNADNGYIKVIGIDTSIWFSLDTSQFVKVSQWDSLPPGTFKLQYLQKEGCSHTEEIVISKIPPPSIEDLQATPSFCGEGNGSIQVKTTGGYHPLRYYLNGQWRSDTSTIDRLVSGDYMVEVIDSDNCRDTIFSTIEAPPYIVIDSVATSPNSCLDPNGRLQIFVNDSTLIQSIWLDSSAENSLLLTNLESGRYTIQLFDINNCQDATNANISQLPHPKIHGLDFVELACNDDYLNVIPAVSVYNDSISYLYNNERIKDIANTKIYPGTNVLTLVDDLGCMVDTIFEVKSLDEFAIANIFSPNDDGMNDLLCVHSFFEEIDIKKWDIYNRWGNLVYSYNTSQLEACWDGRMDGQSVNPGVYVYYLQVRLRDGRMVCRYGDVTVIR